MVPVKITALEAENFKRLRVVEITPTENGLTVVGGRNAQGKSSILGAIAWALGGNKMKPDNPNRDGAATPAKLHVELSNGLVVERRGKNGTLYVTDPTGRKGTQKVLDEFLSVLAISLPKFLEGGDKERTNALLQTLGIDEQLSALDTQIKALYQQRQAIGTDARRLEGYAIGLPHYGDAPEEPVSVAELVQQQQAILARNGENQRKRENVNRLEWSLQSAKQEAARLDNQAKQLQQQLDTYVAQMQQQIADTQSAYGAAVVKLQGLEAELAQAQKTAEQLHDESTAEIEASIANIETINQQVAANQTKAQAVAVAAARRKEYDDCTRSIESLREQRLNLLDGAPLPLPGLSIDEDGRLTYQGHTWGDMSGAEQLRVATAIVRATKPECGFVLVDKLEQFDVQSLAEFGAWAQSEGLQVIGTRVSTGDECTVVIEDGVIEDMQPEPAQQLTPQPTTINNDNEWGAW